MREVHLIQWWWRVKSCVATDPEQVSILIFVVLIQAKFDHKILCSPVQCYVQCWQCGAIPLHCKKLSIL